MRPNKKEPESALFWFQSLSLYVACKQVSYKRKVARMAASYEEMVARMAASYEEMVARMAASYTIFSSTPGSEDA
jgi:prephenate dehydrogenase